MHPEYKQTPAQKELRKLCGGTVPDSVARKVLKILNQMVDDPQIIKIETSGVPTTEDIRRLQQELDTLLQTPPVDEDTARHPWFAGKAVGAGRKPPAAEHPKNHL